MSVQFIRSARPGKPVTWYVYAWRKGPLILKHVGPRKPRLGPAEHAAIARAMADERAAPENSLRELIREWWPLDPAKGGSAEWASLADNTRRVWSPHVDLIEDRWGKHPMTVWDDPRMVEKVVNWRDERRHIPRTADMGVTVLQHFLEFARLRGRVRINVARGVPTLYKGADRAEIIWTDADIVAFAAKAIELERPWVTDGLRLAAVTGLRREDLVTLTWAQVHDFAIVKRALKISRRKRRRAIIPKTPQLTALLAELRERPRNAGIETVLVNSLGRPWTAASFGGSFGRIRDAAGIVHRDPADPDAAPAPKHLHDLRGTFCTLLLTEWGLTDDEAADIMGWSPTRVAHIRKVYVDHERTVVALGQRIAAKQFAKQTGSQSENVN